MPLPLDDDSSTAAPTGNGVGANGDAGSETRPRMSDDETITRNEDSQQSEQQPMSAAADTAPVSWAMIHAEERTAPVGKTWLIIHGPGDYTQVTIGPGGLITERGSGQRFDSLETCQAKISEDPPEEGTLLVVDAPNSGGRETRYFCGTDASGIKTLIPEDSYTMSFGAVQSNLRQPSPLADGPVVSE